MAGAEMEAEMEEGVQDPVQDGVSAIEGWGHQG